MVGRYPTNKLIGRGPLLRRITPLSPRTCVPGMSCGISPAFAGLFPTEGQVTHVLRTRAPCAHPLYCYRKLRTRLACVKHAASVRSEPGSNSRLKLVLRNTKPRFASGPELPSELLIARFTQLSNGFWHILPACQRAASSVLQSGVQTIRKYRDVQANCQPQLRRFPQRGPKALASEPAAKWDMLPGTSGSMEPI